MISIVVASYNGSPLATPLSAQFDELGGNIGRADNNQLVLPDPERTVSRVHAQIVFRSGNYAVVDRGSNPISVNGRALGNGQEAPLKTGDQLQIGGYALRVESIGVGASAKPADPFADFAGLAAPAPATRPAMPAAPAAPAANLDPLAAFGMAPSAAPSPFGASPFGAPSGATGFGSSGASSSAAAGGGGIPDDWDPFAPEPAARGGQADLARTLGKPSVGNLGLEVGGRGAGPLIPDLPGIGGGGGGGGDSLDALFGLGPASGADPLAGGLFGQADAQPNMAAHDDPMKSLNSIGRAAAPAAAQAVPELNTPFDLGTPARKPAAPVAAPVAPPIAPPVAAPVARAAAPAAPSGVSSPPAIPGAVLSWNEPEGAGHTVIRPKAPVPAAPPVAAPAALPPSAAARASLPTEPVPKISPAAAAAMTAAPVAAAPARPAAPLQPGDSAALLTALREGLGVPTLQIDALTPELMKLIGQLLHESARGTVDLLVARSALKREVRAEMTMIVARENNPLKFSPSVEVALGHLLSPPARGFLPADRAMRDAYDDLRAHQFGFLAGMKAALEGILKRFDPAVLEGRLTQKKSMLATLVPGTRKAKMWDVFTELYSQISAEAADDFHELFGKEFLRAYEAHIDQLEKDR